MFRTSANRIAAGFSCVGLISIVLAAPAFGQCPPGTFDYGPIWPDPLVEHVVLSHYVDVFGADGPMTVQIEDYERAARDMDMIRAAFSSAPLEHVWAFVPNQIIIATQSPDDPELACWNGHFDAVLVGIFPPFFVVEFPRAVNVPRMIRVYSQIPSVAGAGENSYSETCSNYWFYQQLPSGVWRWDLHGSDYWRGGCRSVGAWRLSITSNGEMNGWCPGDLDESGTIDISDVTAFLAAFGWTFPDVEYVESADLDGNWSVDIQDLAILLSQFGTACP